MLEKSFPETTGATAIEYGLIACLIAVAVITVIGGTGDTTKPAVIEDVRK